MTFETALPDRQGVILVEYSYHRAHRGARDSLGGRPGAGPPLEPDEPEQVEIEQCWEDGELFEPTDSEVERLQEAAGNHYADHCQQDAPDRKDR